MFWTVGKKSLQVQREPAQPRKEKLLSQEDHLLGLSEETIPGCSDVASFFPLNCCHILQSASLDMQPFSLGNQTNNGRVTLMGMLINCLRSHRCTARTCTFPFEFLAKADWAVPRKSSCRSGGENKRHPPHPTVVEI